MRQTFAILVVSLAFAAPGHADEQPPPAAVVASSKPLGIDFSLRLGPAIGSLPTLNGPMFPLWLGLGYRSGGWLYVGVAGVYAFGPVRSNFDNAQFLFEVAFHPLRYAKVDPWVGYGLGVEWFNGGTAGFIPVSFSMGIDFALAQSFRAGPFFAVQVAFSGNDTHNWYVVGLNLTGLP
jgi:hypothetical protein